MIERTDGKPSEKDLDSVVAEQSEELKRIERYYDRAASKSARLVYFLGMLGGLVLLAALGLGILGVLDVFSERFTHVIFGQAATVAEALGSVPSGKDSKQTEEPPPAVDNPDA